MLICVGRYHPASAMRFPGPKAAFREDLRTLAKLLAA